MGIKSTIKKIGNSAAGSVSSLASLSDKELQKVEKNRKAYLSEMPSLDDEQAIEYTNRLLAASSVEIYNAYLPQIKQLYSPVQNQLEYNAEFSDGHNVRYIKITKWVTNKEENSIEKLINVYQVLSNEECNIALIFHRQRKLTDVYLAITNTKNDLDNNNIESYKNRIVDALKGNFPGCEYEQGQAGTIPYLKEDNQYSIAIASNVPAEKSEKFSLQTIEKLIDGIVPKTRKEEYTIILLATPIQDIEERKMQLAQFYTALAPYASWQSDYHFNDSKTFGSNATVGVNIGASLGSQQGQNNTISQQQGISESRTQSITDTETEALTKGKNSSVGVGVNASVSDTVGASLGNDYASIHGERSTSFGVNANKNWGKSTSKTSSTAKSVADSLGKAVNKSVSKAASVSSSHSFGGNFGANFARSSSVTATVGKNEGITKSHTNYAIKHTLELLEKQMKRYEQSVALGMWDFAAYILSDDVNVCNNVAHSYVALTQGEESYLSQASINVWRGDLGDKSKSTEEIYNYLKCLRHPVFGLNPDIVPAESNFNVYPSLVNATTSLTGKELAYSLNFPKKSITGLPVIECAEFGRNITTYQDFIPSRTIELGNIFHMHHVEPQTVSLDLDSLASHTFITGSTGSGKSNTIYQILKTAKKHGSKFLVIEPAKGEYKHAFSNDKSVNVYGTNPDMMPLLRLNPFRFNKEIHVLEHIDRLTEIFNVCWPMYAAMPAVLKNAIEKSYEDCGWDLTTSKNKYDEEYYPCFSDVCENIKTIIDTSEYDTENKGAYKGSLLTRLQSLINGIYGLIFNKDELSNQELFEENVIIDLSRVGSIETKSLIMGILILKLQEYHLCSNEMNSNLKHLTVLEEAHNILKRTSDTGESGNLASKSVEMISNAIAEMRTYGEGFIIADQAPGLLDLSTIRNTNTKIIMRLPDEQDRILVGKAANLNDNQITELAKLPRGVAAIYQNDWIQPILCKVNKANVSEEMYKYNGKYVNNPIDYDKRYEIASLLSKGEQITDINTLNDLLGNITLKDSTKTKIISCLQNPAKDPKITKLAPIFSDLFSETYNQFKERYNESSDPIEWTQCIVDDLDMRINKIIESKVLQDIIQCIVTNYLYLEKNNIEALEKWTIEGNVL